MFVSEEPYIYHESDGNFVHLFRLGKTNTFPYQSATPSP